MRATRIYVAKVTAPMSLDRGCLAVRSLLTLVNVYSYQELCDARLARQYSSADTNVIVMA